MTDFCHIAPTAYLDLFAADRPFHLTLAHLVEQDKEYADWYSQRALSRSLSPFVNIMDNSAFEMYKQGREMYPSDKLIEMGTKVDADYIVMSDYPGEDAGKTIHAAKKMAPELREAGFGTFFVPQSEIGNERSLRDSFEWAASAPEVDYIGVSILAVPNAYGVEKDNKLQRFLSRWKFMYDLSRTKILDKIIKNGKKLHFLGMVDGPNEIDLVREFLPIINTWDSSAAVWYGLNGGTFDSSPSGLVNGKYEKEVDFSHPLDDTDPQCKRSLGCVEMNIRWIDAKCEGTFYGQL